MKCNRLMRRLPPLLLILALLLSLLAVPASATAFSDVYSTTSTLDAINYVSDNGFMGGTSSTLFSPNVETTRAMFITVLYRKAGQPAVSTSATFSDVVSTAYYAKAVAWAESVKIVDGTSSSLFSPNDPITREAAITMLYRYAKEFCGYDVSVSDKDAQLITAYSDYTTVFNYAKDAMVWAVATGLTTGTSSTTLSPRGTLTRARAALLITRYGTNIEKIVFGKDNLSFVNASTYFTSSRYYISKAHRETLEGLLELPAYKEYLDDVKKYYSDDTTETWGGSCLGMSMVVLLDKYGKIAFNENYGSSAKTMYAVTTKAGSVVESAINFYHLLQFIEPTSTRGEEVKATAANVAAAMQTCIDNDGLTRLGYYWGGDSGTVGHSVIVTSAAVSSSGKVYTLKVCDPNYTTEQTITITINSNGDVVLHNQTTPRAADRTLSSLRVQTDFSIYSILDIDGYTNTDRTASSASAVSDADSSAQSLEEESPLTLQDYLPYDIKTSSLLTATLAGTFTITNAEGEYLYWDGSQLTGTMEVYAENWTVEGENIPSKLVVAVPYSESFQFEQGSSLVDWFSVTSASCYARVSGENIAQALIDTSGAVELTGDAMSFEIACGSESEEASLYILSGTAPDSVTLNSHGDNLTAYGLSGECTFEAVTDYNTSESVDLYADENAALSISRTDESQFAVTQIDKNAVQ